MREWSAAGLVIVHSSSGARSLLRTNDAFCKHDDVAVALFSSATPNHCPAGRAIGS
jgi:hypothetical protein